jgi:hypothetical protein
VQDEGGLVMKMKMKWRKNGNQLGFHGVEGDWERSPHPALRVHSVKYLEDGAPLFFWPCAVVYEEQGQAFLVYSTLAGKLSTRLACASFAEAKETYETITNVR